MLRIRKGAAAFTLDALYCSTKVSRHPKGLPRLSLGQEWAPNKRGKRATFP